MRSPDFFVLDTETGGLDPLQHSLLTVGLVSGDGATQVELLIREPQIHAEPRALAINHVDLAQIEAEGLSPTLACVAIEGFLGTLPEGAMMVGHNVAFDIAFLRRLYGLAARPIPKALSHRSVDTHSLLWALARAGRLPMTATGSDGAFAHFQIAPPPDLRHTALGDAIATRDLVERLLALI
ncbi:3'-5' exonuclease [Myxococcota bacterium]|nr:3'-5' exonuclease [Myxococcota bacterium]MBU1898723.1 3'-5' exonuclease [Myxococcota bacterium]